LGKHKPTPGQLQLTMDSDVVRQIRQHARSCSKTEVCGVLIGNPSEHSIVIEAAIPGLNAAQAGTHVTFTQDTWEHIYRTKDAEFPDQRIAGWYHSHPGFGVFLSDHDTFIHKNFFSSPFQVAWVFDPLSDEEGCFGWSGDRIERLSEIEISDKRGGEGAGETGKPEPVGFQDEFDTQESSKAPSAPRQYEPPRWMSWTVTVLSHLSALGLGLLIAWYVFPRILVVPVDPQTGRPLLIPQIVEQDFPAATSAKDDPGKTPAGQPATDHSSTREGKDAHQQ
jgi:proteasome lid subunit RPN8/RPN11